jgi:hypothetical protein
MLKSRKTRNNILIFAICYLLFAVWFSPAAWAGAKKDIETATAEGDETWEHNFDIKGRKKGTYNYFVSGNDHAGNETIDGPFDIKIDPNSGLAAVKVIYPEPGFVIRQDVDVLGTASAYYGIEKVVVRLDSGAPVEAEGTEYWSAPIEFTKAKDGKHSLFFRATDTKGTPGPETKVDFILDTSPPKLNLVSHKIGDTISRNVNIRGNASDANGIKKVEVSEDGKNFTDLRLIKRRDVSDFILPVNLTGMPDGAKVFYVRATDTTGAITVKSYMFMIKNDAPSLEIYTPGPGEGVSDTFMLSGRSEAKAGLAKLSYEWGKLKGDIPLRPGDPYWSIPLQVEKGATANIKVIAKDNKGKSVNVTRRVNLGGGEILRRTNIQFNFPARNEVVRGGKTVLGFIEHPVQIQSVAYSQNGFQFQEVPFIARPGKAWFSYYCDFSMFNPMRDRLTFRFTDVNGATFDQAPEYTLATEESESAGPRLVLNTPFHGEVITSSFDITGIASGAGVETVHWRFLGPKLDSITKGEAGLAATEAARAFMSKPDVPFEEKSARQFFSIPIDFNMITDGEYDCEVYVKTRDGVKSETVYRTIKVSTAAPVTKIITPPITRYSSHVILVRGYTADANGLEKITISMDRGLTMQEVTLKDDGHWELPLNTAIYTDRVYSALITAEDQYGIVSFATAMINIDNTEPAVVITSPKSGDYVGTEMKIEGRIADNIELKSLNFQVINVVDPTNRISIDVEPKPVIFEPVSLETFRAGEFIVRVLAKDLSDNETVISRKIIYDPYDIQAQIAIYSPLPGEEHTGPVYLAGLVTGVNLPEKVQLMLDGEEFQELDVDRFGVFRYDISEEELATYGQHKLYAFYKTERGRTVASASHSVYYQHYGPILLIDSHRDGDHITNRPWLRGEAMFVRPPKPDGKPYTRAEISQFAVKYVEVSYDNGRTFKKAIGKGNWRWRLEPLDLPHGTQPIVVRATFENGEEAVRRILLFMDPEAPMVETVSPPEKSHQRDELKVYGAASDNLDLTDVNVTLRPFHKFWYSVPDAIRGLYIDVKSLGATYFDVGLGLSFFGHNVRLQGQYGLAPAIGIYTNMVEGGRYVGNVLGFKLIANIATIPFDWLFKDRDWIFYKMNVAVGANFSWFEMEGPEGWRKPLYMGAVLAQIDLANVDFNYIYPKWKYFHIMSLYMQPELWFASTDALTDGLGHKVPKEIFRIGIGLRFNVF